MYFWTYGLRKTWLDKSLKSLVSEDPSTSKHGKRAEALLKSERHHLYSIYWSLWNQFRWKRCLLVICKILGLFVNTLTAEDKFSLLNRDNLQEQLRCKYWKKAFLNFLFHFRNLDSILNINKKRWPS